MRKFTVINILSIDGNPIKHKIKVGDQLEVIPEIRKMFKFKGIELRCTEHQIGKVILRNDEMILKLSEVFE